MKHFRKSQSKFPKNFLFRENRQKVKCCPTPYSRWSKTFELYHFQSPREEKRFKETSSSLARKTSQLEYYLVKILQDNAFFNSAKNRPKIPIFSAFINNENLRNFERENHGLVRRILEELLYLRKAPLL